MVTDEVMSSRYFGAAIVAVFALVAAVWWYTAVNTAPSIPNTGTSTPDALEYSAD